MIKKLLCLLVLLLTATTGAWAQAQTYKVTLQEGTEDASNWQGKAGEGAYQALPLKGVAAGTAVTATYSGTKKVKSVKAVKVAPDNTYLEWDAGQRKLVKTDIQAEVTTVQNAASDVEWAAGTHVVEDDVTISGTITLTGDVNLIIKDGATLTANGILGSSSKYNLSIYGQASQTGQLVVNSSGYDAISYITTLEVHSAKVKATSSQYNCGGLYQIETFNVYGGLVDAECTKEGYGIGLNEGGSMNIYGGEVKAEGKGNGADYSYGIRSSNSGATVTVHGGKLWAGCADKAALRNNITLTKGGDFNGKIEYSSDNSTWSETVDTSAKYVRVGY